MAAILSKGRWHYCDVIMGTMVSQITSLAIVYSTFYTNADQIKHQSSASLTFLRGIHRWPVNSPHKWPVTQKIFPFDDVNMLMRSECLRNIFQWNFNRNWSISKSHLQSGSHFVHDSIHHYHLCWRYDNTRRQAICMHHMKSPINSLRQSDAYMRQ